MNVWDYDIEKLKKSERGRILLLERQINYGVYRDDKEKIPLGLVKKYWNDISVDPNRRKLLQLLL